MAAIISFLVLAGAVAVLFPFLLALTYWLDRPQTEAVWQEELRAFPSGLLHFVISRLHRVWLRREGKNHEGNLRIGKGVSAAKHAPADKDNRGGGGGLSESRDGHDSSSVFPGHPGAIRGRDGGSDGRVSQGGEGETSASLARPGEGTPLSGENRGPRPSGGVRDLERPVQPAGTDGGRKRADLDGLDGSKESFAETLERRGRELGI